MPPSFLPTRVRQGRLAALHNSGGTAFVRLTQDFQKIHETTGSIEEEGLGANGLKGVDAKLIGQEGLPMRSPIELSDEGSEGKPPPIFFSLFLATRRAHVEFSFFLGFV